MNDITIKVDVRLPVLFKRENGSVVAYCPPFDLASYGSTRREAEANIKEAIQMFVEDIFQRNTWREALRELGWKKHAPQRHTPASFASAKRYSVHVETPLPLALLAQPRREIGAR